MRPPSTSWTPSQGAATTLEKTRKIAPAVTKARGRVASRAAS